MRILAIDTATEACSVALWNDGTVNAHFELCPREHTQRILPMVQDILTTSGTSLTDINALAYGRGPGSFTGVRIGIGIAQGLALGAELPMIGVSTLMTMAQGAWRKNGATRVLAAIDARMGEVYWAEYQRDENGIWHGEETEAVLKPEIVHERMQQHSGEWVTVGRAGKLGRISVKRAGWFCAMAKCYCLLLKICCRLRVRCLLRVKRWRWNMPNRFIYVTTSHGRNFRAKNES